MTFHRIKDAAPLPHEFVCRASAWPWGIAAATSLGVAVALCLVPAAGCIRAIVLAIAAVLALAGMMFARTLLRTFGQQNWLMRISPRSGVWLKFRSFANAHFSDEDEAVVQLEPREIAWVGSLRKHHISPGPSRGRRIHRWITSLEIGLHDDVQTFELDRRLTEERRREPPGKHVRTKFHDYPMRLIKRSTLQIEWHGGRSSTIRPPVKRVLRELAQFGEVRPMRKVRTDSTERSGDDEAAGVTSG